MINTLYIHKRYLVISEVFMSQEKRQRFTVIENQQYGVKSDIVETESSFHTNPMYEKLLNFRNLQEQQKKKLFKKEVH